MLINNARFGVHYLRPPSSSDIPLDTKANWNLWGGEYDRRVPSLPAPRPFANDRSVVSWSSLPDIHV